MKNNVVKSFALLMSIASLVGCSQLKSTESDANSGASISSYEHPTSFDASKYTSVVQLRKVTVPSGEVTLNDQTVGYKTFTSKMKDFSNKLTEILVNERYNANANLTISPLSIELCLGLAARSANSQTRKEILDAFGLDFDTFDANYKTFFLKKSFEATRKENKNAEEVVVSKMTPNNSIWINDRATLKENGLNALQTNYCCDSFKADFTGNNGAANQAMRDYVYEKTNKLLDVKFENPTNTLFVLMNTIYLKDIWGGEGSTKFSYDIGGSYTFKNANGSVSTKKLLRGKAWSGRAISNENYSSFYTKTGKGTLYFVKPNEGKTLKEVFSKETIDYVTDNSNYVTYDADTRKSYSTECVFPEFEAYTDLKLKNILMNQFYVKSMFGSDCDFTELTDSSVYAEDVYHVARLKVKQEGVEGAAVTYIPVPTMGDSSVREDFVLDKEFGYVLTYDGDIVFSGVVTNID